MKGAVNVTLKTLSAEFPVWTKAGKIWKNRINWVRIEVTGTAIITHFGVFTFIKAERIDKIWYWTLEDEQGNQFTIKREQARYNKRMPRTAKKQIAQPRTFTFKYQLCLPAPMELIDSLLASANVVAHSRRGETWEAIQEELDEDIEDGWILTDEELFTTKVRFIYKNLDVKRVYKQLAHEYHPDKSTEGRAYFEIVNLLYNIYKK